jgi:hypothetical protein
MIFFSCIWIRILNKDPDQQIPLKPDPDPQPWLRLFCTSTTIPLSNVINGSGH